MQTLSSDALHDGPDALAGDAILLPGARIPGAKGVQAGGGHGFQAFHKIAPMLFAVLQDHIITAFSEKANRLLW
jgi:hypothetical protein